MKFLCLGYFSPERMEARPSAEIEAVMRECEPHLAELYRQAPVVADVGLMADAKCVRRVRGEVTVGDGPFVGGHAMIGSVFLIEAADIEEAIRLAALHPTIQVHAGEQLGWGLEIRPVHYFALQPPPADLPVSHGARAG